MSNESIGERLRRLRRRAGLTQQEVGPAMKQSGFPKGVTVTYLSLIERDKRRPSFSLLEKLAKVYGYESVADMLDTGHQLLLGTEEVPQDRLDWAYQSAIRDPQFAHGRGLEGLDIPDEGKRFIVEIYQRATGIHMIELNESKIEQTEKNGKGQADIRKRRVRGLGEAVTNDWTD